MFFFCSSSLALARSWVSWTKASRRAWRTLANWSNWTTNSKPRMSAVWRRLLPSRLTSCSSLKSLAARALPASSSETTAKRRRAVLMKVVWRLARTGTLKFQTLAKTASFSLKSLTSDSPTLARASRSTVVRADWMRACSCWMRWNCWSSVPYSCWKRASETGFAIVRTTRPRLLPSGMSSMTGPFGASAVAGVSAAVVRVLGGMGGWVVGVGAITWRPERPSWVRRPYRGSSSRRR